MSELSKCVSAAIFSLINIIIIIFAMSGGFNAISFACLRYNFNKLISLCLSADDDLT